MLSCLPVVAVDSGKKALEILGVTEEKNLPVANVSQIQLADCFLTLIGVWMASWFWGIPYTGTACEFIINIVKAYFSKIELNERD